MCVFGEGIGREEQGEDGHDAVVPAYRRRGENSVCPQTVRCVIFHLFIIDPPYVQMQLCVCCEEDERESEWERKTLRV